MKTEIITREKTKLVLKYLEESNFENAKQVILNHPEILNYNFGLNNYVSLIPKILVSNTILKKNESLKLVVNCGFEISCEKDNHNDLLFFAAAKCDVEKLKYSVQKILQKDPRQINQVREGNSALIFLIKYGNHEHQDLSQCVKILIEAGINVNKQDYLLNTPIKLLLNKLLKQKNDKITENLKKCIQLLLDTNSIDLDLIKTNLQEQFQTSETVSRQKENNTKEDDIGKLFKLLLNGDEEAFKKSVLTLKQLNADDGYNTFLQLCCEKNFKTTAKFLIENGANLTKTTERNHQTPLEIAARRNHTEIFDALLSTNKIIIDENLFLTFLYQRPKHIKAKYFDEILKHKYLDTDIKAKNGNTPLHYAIIFSSTEAISALLKRGASLTVQNDQKKCPLDYINAKDLENYLDNCILPDTYIDKNNGKYNLGLNYQSLVETEDHCVKSELTVIDKISNSNELSNLLNHALISSFIDIKWKLVKPFYTKLFVFNLFFYFVSVLSLFNLKWFNYLALGLNFMYSIKIAFFFDWKSNKLHQIVDILMVATLVFSNQCITNFSNIFRYFLGLTALVLILSSLHLFWRYEPTFSYFYSILIFILKRLLPCLSYIFILTLFGSAVSYIFFLIQNDNENSTNDKSVLFLIDTIILLARFYMLCAFGVFTSVLVLMIMSNFSLKMLENSKSQFLVMSKINVLTFLKNVEQFYMRFSNLIESPLIFEENPEKNINKQTEKKKVKNKNNFIVNYLVNVNKFSFKKLLPVTLSDDNVIRIKNSIK